MHALTATGTTVMHLVLDPAPPLTAVVEVTDDLRGAALSRLDWTGDNSMLAGKTAAGEPLAGQHGHAHWLPVTDGRVVAGICLWTPAGLSPAEVAAVASVRRFGPGGSVTATLLHGSRPLPPMLAAPSSAWESLTPFVPPGRLARGRRRADGRARGGADRDPAAFLAAMASAELERRGLPGPAVTDLGPVHGWETRRPSRPETVSPPRRLRLEFAEPVEGPIAIGRLSHFGLGLFRPC